MACVVGNPLKTTITYKINMFTWFIQVIICDYTSDYM